jgi:hypothetical protein
MENVKLNLVNDLLLKPTKLSPTSYVKPKSKDSDSGYHIYFVTLVIGVHLTSISTTWNLGLLFVMCVTHIIWKLYRLKPVNHLEWIIVALEG